MNHLPRIEPLGESALLVTLADTASPEASARLAWLAERLRDLRNPAITDVVPAYGALAVFLDSTADASMADAAPLEARVRQLAMSIPTAPRESESAGRVHTIPVVYDGPDLDEVAKLAGLTCDEVVRHHAGRLYQAYFLGFVPGFAYLGPLDDALVLPRRIEPRRRVPAGSVAIAGAQTGIYPLETPGGWHILGRTDVVLFDPAGEPPSLIAAGDLVRFEPRNL